MLLNLATISQKKRLVAKPRSTMASKKHNLWQHYSNCEISHLSDGNKIITDVVKLMLGGGTFLFALTGTLFGSKILTLPLSLKILLIVSWSLIFFSFYFGINQLISDSSFLGKWSRNYSKAKKVLAEIENEDTAMKAAEKVFEDQNIVSNMQQFWNQVYLIGLAFVIQVTIVSISLFLKIN